MEKEEYIRKSQNIGYTKEMIEETMHFHEESEKLGIIDPYENEVLETLPTGYPCNKFNKVIRKSNLEFE